MLSEKAIVLRKAEVKVNREIRLTNEDEDWIADWSDIGQLKFWVTFNHKSKTLEIAAATCLQNPSITYGCEKAIIYVMGNMPEELKLIAGIDYDVTKSLDVYL